MTVGGIGTLGTVVILDCTDQVDFYRPFGLSDNCHPGIYTWIGDLFSGDGPTETVPIASTPTPPAPKLKVLFIQGIGSTSCKNPNDAAADFAEHVKWLRDSLQKDVEGLNDDSFLYYAYTSERPKPTPPRSCLDDLCPKGVCPDYNKHDACWSLDDRYRPATAVGPTEKVIGQGQRLASYIADNVADDEELSIVAHSQGGVLAAYMVQELDRRTGSSDAKWPNAESRTVRAIVTLDSPLRGIGWFAADVLRGIGSCGDDRREDSHRDMHDGLLVGPDGEDGEGGPAWPAATKLYTIDADPGCFEIKPTDVGFIDSGISLFVKAIRFWRCPNIPEKDTTLSGWAGGEHVQANADTHTDIWRGVFEGSTNETATKTLVQKFIACAVGELADGACKAYAEAATTASP